jgi:hypothetical protein
LSPSNLRNINLKTQSEEKKMADQMSRSGAGSPGGSSHADTLKSFSEQAVEAGRDYKDKAANIAGASTDKLKDQASGLASDARDMVGQAADKIKETVSDKKAAGAEYVGSLAETIRRASREFDNDLPIAGKYIRKAASQVENVADSIRSGEFSDLVRNAQSFARRHDGEDTYFRLHGTNEPDTIGTAASSGCIRLVNEDIEDLYDRVPIGAPVVVLPT